MKTLRRRLGCLLLSAVLLLSMIPAAFAAPTPGMDNFKRVNTYTAGTFSDVPEGKWYTDSIKAAYEYGLALGSDGKFDRTSNMTVATAVTLAARLHAIYHTGSTAALVQGSPWYQVYVDYALTNGIIEAGQFANYDKTDASRAQCAVMLSKAIPADELPAINTVEDGAIPDVSADAPYYDDIYALYRAGILTGNDDKGTFTPDATIDRTAFFTIATRLMDKSLRRDLTLKVELTGIQVKPTLWLFPGDTYQLSAAPVPSGAKLPAVTWSSADTKIATVSATGLVTMVAPGKTTVTAQTPGGLSAACTVNVMPRAVTGVTLDQTSVTKDEGQTVQLTATVEPDNASNKTLTWTSSNPKVATVSATGLVSCVAAGTAIITAKASSGESAACTVTVKAVFKLTDAQLTEYAARTFRSVRYDYPSATGKHGYAIAFTDKNGDQCVMTYVYYQIIRNYSQTTLYNLTKGTRIEDPADYYSNTADRYYGANAIRYLELASQALSYENKAITGVRDYIATGKNTGPGVYVGASILNL